MTLEGVPNLGKDEISNKMLCQVNIDEVYFHVGLNCNLTIKI